MMSAVTGKKRLFLALISVAVVACAAVFLFFRSSGHRASQNIELSKPPQRAKEAGEAKVVEVKFFFPTPDLTKTAEFVEQVEIPADSAGALEKIIEKFLSHPSNPLKAEERIQAENKAAEAPEVFFGRGGAVFVLLPTQAFDFKRSAASERVFFRALADTILSFCDKCTEVRFLPPSDLKGRLHVDLDFSYRR